MKPGRYARVYSKRTLELYGRKVYWFDVHQAGEGARVIVTFSLVNQTASTSVLDVLHHQHEEGGSGHSGTVFETQRNVQSKDYTPQLVVW